MLLLTLPPIAAGCFAPLLLLASLILAVVSRRLGPGQQEHPKSRAAGKFAVAASVALVVGVGVLPLGGSGLAGLSACGLVLWLPLLLVGSVLALVALARTRSAPEQWLGARRQARRVLTAGVLGLAATLLVLARDDSPPMWVEAKARTRLEFADLNFRFAVPPKPWIKLDIERLNPDAALGFSLRQPRAFFVVIAEPLGIECGWTSDALAEVARHNLLHVAPEARIEEREHRVAGLDGRLLSSDLHEKGGGTIYRAWVVAHNGFGYQLVLEGSAKFRKEFEEVAGKLFESFELIDRDRVARSDGFRPAIDFVSTRYGYSARFGSSRWSSIPEPHSQHLAEYAAQLGAGAMFHAIPVALAGEDPSLECVAKGLLACLGIDYQRDHFLARRRIEEQDCVGIELEHERDAEDSRIRYRLRVLKGERFGYLFAVWHDPAITGATDPLSDPLSDALARVSLAAAEPATPRDMRPWERRLHGLLWMNFGRYYSDAGAPEDAVRYYRKAYELNRDDASLLIRLAHAWIDAGQVEFAHAYLREERRRFESDTDLLAVLALVQAGVGEIDASLQTYDEVMRLGLPGLESRLEQYVELLVMHERVRPALRILAAHREAGQDTQALCMLEARLHGLLGDHGRAVALLRGWQEGAPFSQPLAQQAVEHCYLAGEHEQVRELCRELIARGFDTARTLFQKGRSELELRLYEQALASLEVAAARAPSDPAIEVLLQQAREGLKQP